jgi:hypothetical protein
MIKVELSDKDYKVCRNLGTFSPKEIKDLVSLIEDYGAMIGNTKYQYYTSHYDMDTEYYTIVVDEF